MPLHSCIYEGHVSHERLTPLVHRFRYSVFMVYLDLGELPTLFRRRWFWSSEWPNLAWFRRNDYLGPPRQDLAESVRERVDQELGFRPAGPVRLLTNLRYWGFLINPISFYFCFANDGKRIEAILAEVTNTPWNERHVYALDARLSSELASELEFESSKELHVSPFFDMQRKYNWRIQIAGDRIDVGIRHKIAEGVPFSARLLGQRREINSLNLARVIVLYPALTILIFLRIYWQAFRLWWKRVPFCPHPLKVQGFLPTTGSDSAHPLTSSRENRLAAGGESGAPSLVAGTSFTRPMVGPFQSGDKS